MNLVKEGIINVVVVIYLCFKWEFGFVIDLNMDLIVNIEMIKIVIGDS